MSTSSPSTLTTPLTLNNPTSPFPSSRGLRGPSSFLQVQDLNTSSTSLPSGQQSSKLHAPVRDPLLRAHTQVGPSGEPSAPLGALGRSTQQQRHQAQHQSEGDRTDALWGEMQATLAEVELSAARGTHFFGPAHADALEQLRQSQVALAQAWARSEVLDEVVEGGGEAGRSEESSQLSPGQSVAEGKGDDDRQEEAEKDILVARRRRAANDRYFERVGKGVLDVVGRLEEVATAMGKVERESREVWSDNESLDSASVA